MYTPSMRFPCRDVGRGVLGWCAASRAVLVGADASEGSMKRPIFLDKFLFCAAVGRGVVCQNLSQTAHFSASWLPQPGDGPGDEGGDAQAIPTIDRAAAMEDCSRLVNEAEQSAPLVQATGEALAVLTSTVLAASPALSPEAAAGVSAEVVSAVTDAEGLVDGLLRVIQVGFLCA